MTWQAFVALFRKPSEPTRFADADAIDDQDERLAAAGRAAIAEAERLFDLDVIDPPFGDKRPQVAHWLAVITSIIRAAGWGFALPYLGNRKGATQWCGMFAATCWRAAGIDPSILATFWASTLRLVAWGKGKPFGGKPNKRPAGLAGKIVGGKLPFDPRAGDILVIGDGDPVEGQHICLVVRYAAARRVFVTIEGNGWGLGPDGAKREGIVRGERPVKSAMWLYRPSAGSLVA